MPKRFLKGYGSQSSVERRQTEMLGKLMHKEEVNAALVLALSGTVMALVAKGDGPLSLRQVVAGVLSDPVSKVAASTRRYSYVPASRRQQITA